jgi:protein-S-isoprenylcysteine O-methyltransferase Ste14
VTHAQHVIAAVGLAVCWGAFAITWVGGAVYNAARGPRRSFRAPTGPSAIAALVAIIALVVIVRVVPADDWDALKLVSPWATGIGLVVLLGSTAFTLWARFTLGTMWSLDPTVKRGHALRTDGPYGITRHPIYTGLLGMFLGTLLLVGVGRALLLVPAGLLLIELRIRAEEKLMTRTFPDDYPRYRRRVPQLIPGLRIWRLGAGRPGSA